jgi:hypothetical protein
MSFNAIYQKQSLFIITKQGDNKKKSTKNKGKNKKDNKRKNNIISKKLNWGHNMHAELGTNYYK